jgi:hypothetical protein
VYFPGGRTSIKGVADRDLQRNVRYGITLSIPIATNWSAKIAWPHWLITTVGGNFETVGCRSRSNTAGLTTDRTIARSSFCYLPLDQGPMEFVLSRSDCSYLGCPHQSRRVLVTCNSHASEARAQEIICCAPRREN